MFTQSVSAARLAENFSFLSYVFKSFYCSNTNLEEEIVPIIGREKTFKCCLMEALYSPLWNVAMENISIHKSGQMEVIPLLKKEVSRGFT